MIRIIGLITLGMLFACGGSPTSGGDVEKQAFDDMRAEVRRVIDDPEREASVVALVENLEEQYTVLRDTAATRRKALRELNADYDATRGQFAEFLDTHNAQLERSHKAFLESHRALIDATTAEEWSTLAKSNMKSMTELARRFASI